MKHTGTGKTLRILVSLILTALLCLILIGCGSAEEKKELTPFITINRRYTEGKSNDAKGQTNVISGPESGTSGNTLYVYKVQNNDGQNIKKYRYILAILDDVLQPDTADTLYKSNITEENQFSTYFYLPGEYVLFVSRYDKEDKLVDSYQKVITITEGNGENALTDAVNTAKNACLKSTEFETAVAISDYLADLVTYDDTHTYYGPQDALTGSHTCVCSGYSRA